MCPEQLLHTRDGRGRCWWWHAWIGAQERYPLLNEVCCWKALLPQQPPPALQRPRDAVPTSILLSPAAPPTLQWVLGVGSLLCHRRTLPYIQAPQKNRPLLSLPTSRHPMHCSGSARCCSFHQSNLRSLPAAASSTHSPCFRPFPLRASLLFPQAILLYPCEKLLFSSSIQPALHAALLRPLRLWAFM